MTETLPGELQAAAARCAASPREALVIPLRPYQAATTTEPLNQLILMLKPELLRVDRGVNVAGITRLLLDRMRAFGIEPGATVVLSAAELARGEHIRAHYPILNRVTHEGAGALAERPRRRLEELLETRGLGGAPVLGGYEFLRRNADFSARALETLCRNTETTKLGTGVYAIVVTVDGSPLVILNPFHPRQLERFEEGGGAIAVLDCRTARSIQSVRSEFLGATDPRDAAPGSLKRFLFEQSEALGLGPISIASNGVHVSPGAVEGMFSVLHFFAGTGHAGHRLSPAATVMGRALLAGGWDEREILALSGATAPDPTGLDTPLLEISEDWDTEGALAFLQRHRRRLSGDAGLTTQKGETTR